MASERKLKLYFVVGEESGDILGSKMIETFAELDSPIEPVGLGGERMREKGVNSLFNISELSVMGISGVLRQLPNLLKRIRQTVEDVVKQKPDMLLLIDSPEFSYRVAKQVRKRLPQVKIVKYVAPSVWAWRPGRARKISAYVDHVLAILPFEPDLLAELGGPPATYVGHPLSANMPEVDAKSKRKSSETPKLLILPGSRKSETKRLLPFLRETLEILKQRGNSFEVTLPAVERLENEIRSEVTSWSVSVNVVSGDEAKTKAFLEADIALAASGTVTLELALHKVPMISIYKLDGLAMQIRHMLTGWTASLPNLVADYPVVPERFNEYAHPHYVARMVERLVMDDHERKLQLKGFELVRKRLQQQSPSHQLAAEKILDLANS
ncbi:MAG: lipid-A-disaccharide synthase [Pseudomonadota bacterium]